MFVAKSVMFIPGDLVVNFEPKTFCRGYITEDLLT